jgi:hypothetical protein
VLATQHLAMPLLDPRRCDGHHIFIDFATPIAMCVNRFTYGMRAET